MRNFRSTHLQRRLKIYHLLTTQTRLQPISGDRINEINFLIALSQFADVYYNNQLFKPEEPDYGLVEKEIEIPGDKYDLYIVRNNLDVFKAIKGKKIWLSYPYNEEAFKVADAVTTFNQAWKEGLDRFHEDESAYHFFCGAYPREMTKAKAVLNIKQVLGSHFEPKQGSQLHFRYKARFGHGFTIGYFGRIEDETLPKDYLTIVQELQDEIPDLTTVFAGSIRIPLEEKSIINVKSIPFEEMPYATSACDILLGNEQPEANWAGSAKPLEAMACGVPIIVTKRPARVDQLGEDYPLYYSTPEEMRDLILRLYREPAFYRSVRDGIIASAQAYYPDQISDYLKNLFRKFLQK